MNQRSLLMFVLSSLKVEHGFRPSSMLQPKLQTRRCYNVVLFCTMNATVHISLAEEQTNKMNNCLYQEDGIFLVFVILQRRVNFLRVPSLLRTILALPKAIMEEGRSSIQLTLDVPPKIVSTENFD